MNHRASAILQVQCRSGLKGWQARLRKIYSSLAEFVTYCSIYNNHARLGYATPETAWRANPIIQGSVNPSDYRRVR
jgi:hypothetical protein